MAQKTESQTTAKPRRGKWRRLALVAVLLATAGAYVVHAFGLESNEPPPEPQLTIVDLAPVVANLKDSYYYLRIAVSVEVVDDPHALDEIDSKKHRIHDGLIKLFRTKSVKDIRQVDSDKLRQEILQEISKHLDRGVVDVFFKEIIFQ